MVPKQIETVSNMLKGIIYIYIHMFNLFGVYIFRFKALLLIWGHPPDAVAQHQLCVPWRRESKSESLGLCGSLRGCVSVYH